MPRPNFTYAAGNPKRPGSDQEVKTLVNLHREQPDNEFIASVFQQYQRWGVLTAKQWAAVMKNVIAVPTAGTSQNMRAPDFDGKKLQELFKTASQHLQYPKMRIPGVGSLLGQPIEIYLSVKSPQYAGQILFTNAKDGVERVIYALVNKAGEGFFNFRGLQKLEDPQVFAELRGMILRIAEDPVNTAKVTGIEYGHCCFCGLPLTNASSVFHGYGPICAGKWHLPWGDCPDKEEILPDV